MNGEVPELVERNGLLNHRMGNPVPGVQIPPSPPPESYFYAHANKTEMTILLTDMEEENQLMYVAHLIRTVKVKKIHLRINSYGGYVHIMKALIRAMRDSKAKIITYCESIALSAGATVFLAGDEKVVYPESVLMLHTISGAYNYTYLKDIIDEASIQTKSNIAFTTPIYKQILTLKELDEMNNGKTFWFTGEEVAKRLKIKITV